VYEHGAWRKLRFHDYAEIYERPGLYEHLFYGLLGCRSPTRVARLLLDVCEDAEIAPRDMRVVDIGAGNGIMGQRLRERGVGRVMGIDILPSAAHAAERDRSGVYDEYLVEDLTRLRPDVESRVRAFRPTCLTCVAALGFGDIPPSVFYNVLGLLPKGSLLAFNIKEDFLDARYTHGFSELIRRALEGRVLRAEATRRYQHRRGVDGRGIFYTAFVATKLDEVPASMLIDP
jgi:predicted TPR repeat methyltransferase